MNSDNLKNLVAKAPFGYAFHKIIVDDSGTPIDYEFIGVNPAFERLTGLKSCDILNKTVLQAIPDIVKDSFDWIGFYGEIAINGEEKEFEQYSQTLDRWYKVQAYSPEKYYFITVFSDITDHKRTEDVLNENVGNYSDIFQTISEGIAHTTLTGKVISINNALEKILDIPKEKILGRNILSLAKNLLSAKNFKVAAPFLKGLIQGKGVSGIHLEYKNKVLELNASINKETRRLTGVIRDITERKQFEESLFQTRLFLNSIIDQSPNSMWISDEHGNAIRVNQACRNLFSLKDEEVVGKYNIFKDNIVEEQGFMPMVRDVFKNGTTARFTIHYDTSAVKILELGRTTQVFLEVHISPILNSQGKVTNAIIQHIDITEQKLAEEKLRESKQIIEGIINTIPAGVFWKDKNLNYLGCNLVTAIDAGFLDQKEVIGKNDFQMGWRNRAELYRIDDLHVIESESSKVNIEEELTNATGETVTILTTKIPLKNSIGEVTGVLGTYVDITERKRSEEQILKSEARYRNIINISPVPMALNDEQQNITFLNSAFVQSFGYSMEDIPTLSSWWPKAYPDADYRQWVTDNWQSELQKSKQTGAAFNPMELTVKCKNGTDKTVLAAASSIFDGYEGEHLVILYDITDRKKAEDKLREKDVQFRKLSSNLPDLIFQFTRRPDGTYCVPIASEGIKNIFGCSPEDVIEDFSPIGKVIYSEDLDRVISDIEYSAEHLTHFTCEFRVQIPGKPIQWIFSRSTPEKLTDGSITWYGFNANITEMKQTEFELTRAKEKAEESDRLKSAFLANMSHEIRTPMNGILGFTQLLKEPELTGEEQKKFIGIIEKSGARLLNIINDIVDMSKIEAGLMETTISEANVNEKIDFIYNFFKPEAELKKIHFTFNHLLPAKEAIIKTDPEKIYAILTNLVSNAMKFTHEGSIEFGYEKKEKYLEFYVKDTGIGISKQHKEIIFERFRQGDKLISKNYEGTGLGLSISKSYVEMLGGTMWVESEFGNGATFYFTLPYNVETEKKEVHKDDPPTSGAEQHVKNLKILIAEDDENSEFLLTTIVKKISADILNVRTGVEAVEACRNNPGIDLVLMDITMPELNGYEATRQIRTFNKDVVIIAQTAYALAGDREKALEAGCNDYISKPLKHSLLRGLIQKYFN